MKYSQLYGKKGIKEPFEIHVINKDMLKIYARRAKLIRIDEYIRKHST